jgi:tetratricopeptide (TPR) repeat protein
MVRHPQSQRLETKQEIRRIREQAISGVLIPTEDKESKGAKGFTPLVSVVISTEGAAEAEKPEGFTNAFEKETPSTSLGSPNALKIRESEFLRQNHLPHFLTSIRNLAPTLLLLFTFIFSLFTSASAQDQSLITRADSSFATADYPQLLEDCNAAIAAFPDTAFLYYYRGMASFMLGDNPNALTDYDRAIELEPTYAEPFIARARVHYSNGDLEAAHKDIRSSLRRDPASPEAYLLRAEIYLDEGVLTEAWADLEDAKKRTPKDPELFCLRSEYYLLLGEPRLAIKEAGTAIKLAPDDALGYATQATAYQAAGDYANAKSDIDIAIQWAPEDYSLLATRAMILDAMGDRDKAMEDLERYMARDSLAWDAYLTRAWFYMQDTNWTAAEADLLTARKMQPQEVSILDQLGYLYVLKEDFQKAREVLQPLVERAESEAFARANLAYAILRLGDADSAMKEIQQAIKLDEYEPRCYLYRAAIYHELKKPAKACEDLQTAEDLGFIEYYGEEELAALRKKACE